MAVAVPGYIIGSKLVQRPVYRTLFVLTGSNGRLARGDRGGLTRQQPPRQAAIRPRKMVYEPRDSARDSV